ncbi:MAG: hypothetical protein JF615_08580 [Asticcacaulis sp.]|nr:hypothetical protein [Asticcacaulis sp.]
MRLKMLLSASATLTGTMVPPLCKIWRKGFRPVGNGCPRHPADFGEADDNVIAM